MKKLLSLLIATVISTSLVATTAFAATPNVSASFTATEVNIGETFTLSINSGEKTIYAEDVRLKYDLDKFEIVSKKGVYNGAEAADMFGLTQSLGAFGTSFYAVDFNALSDGSGYSWSKLVGSATTFLACTLAKIEFRALAAGTYTFTLEEYSGYSGASDHTGFDGVAGTYTVTVVDPNAGPVVDETIEVDATAADDAVNGTKTWGVTVGADLLAAGVKAILTNSHADVVADNTQEVALTFGEIDKNSQMQCEFDVIVKLQDYAKYANNISLNIVKAAN